MFKQDIPAFLVIIIIISALIVMLAVTYWHYVKIPSNISEEKISITSEGNTEKGKESLIENKEKTEQQDEREKEEERKEERKEENLIRKDFSYPYPLGWSYQHAKTLSFKYYLTGVSLGRRKIPSFVKENVGEEINALTLYLKIVSVGKYGAQICLDVDLGMVVNEQGDFISPINRRFNAGCFRDGQSYYNQEVIFEVPLNKKEFVITTGGDSNIFFTVKILDNGDIRIIKEIPVG